MAFTAGVFRVAGAAITLNGAHNVTGSTQVGGGSLTFANANTALNCILYLYGGSINFTGTNTVNPLDLGSPGSASGSPTAVLNGVTLNNPVVATIKQYNGGG